MLPFRWRAILLVLASQMACCGLNLDRSPLPIRPIYDLAEGDIPLPNDLVRDEDAGHLDLPTDEEDLTPAEIEFRTMLNEMDGWPTTYTLEIEFSGPISADTLSPSSVQVWRWADPPVREVDYQLSTEKAGTVLKIDPPMTGWLPGSKFVVIVRGGEVGVRGRLNEPVVADPSFYYVRLDQELSADNERAFPGDTRDERIEKAADLEEVRLELKPYLDYFEQAGTPRDEIEVAFSFTTTAHPELAMDRASQRIPLPFDLLLDPATGKVELPIHDDDDDLRRQIKAQVNGLDGFALSADLTFESTQRLDPATVSARDIKLYELGGLPVELPVDAWLMADGKHVVVELSQEAPLYGTLKEQTTYALVIYDGLADPDGRALASSPVGMFLKGSQPVYAQGRSLNGALDDAEAERIEDVRVKLAGLLDQVGRDRVVTGWTFTTQSVMEPFLAQIDAAERLSIDPDPVLEEIKTPLQAIGDFLIGIASLLDVEEVLYGTIKTPEFLDPVSRAFRPDGLYSEVDVPWVMTIPKDADPNEPLPVVIFGHAIMTESRFVLALGDFLARRGFAAIAIDFPYHGKRTHCKRGGPISVPHPLTGELIDLDPCTGGTTCAVDGRCVDSQGQGGLSNLTQWPIINFPMASGSAFLEMEHLDATRDHFTQAVIDLRSLVRSLEQGDWKAATGYTLATDRFYFIGQSLGGIIGSVFTTVTPQIERAVWNVPGSDLVDMFDQSGYFGLQVNAFFQREDILRSSYDAEQFLNVARWIMDGVDPAVICSHKTEDEREFMIQLATLDFIIPNWTTEKLGAIAEVPIVEYIAEHAFLCIPVEPAYVFGGPDAADFLAGEFQP